jgi:hypothetical protein
MSVEEVLPPVSAAIASLQVEAKTAAPSSFGNSGAKLEGEGKASTTPFSYSAASA